MRLRQIITFTVSRQSGVGPWETATGKFYFIMKPTETDNVFMMVKSADSGKSWVELDGNNRPILGDMEGLTSHQPHHPFHRIVYLSNGFHSEGHAMNICIGQCKLK